jgi:hypothetical protein
LYDTDAFESRQASLIAKKFPPGSIALVIMPTILHSTTSAGIRWAEVGDIVLIMPQPRDHSGYSLIVWHTAYHCVLILPHALMICE